MLLLEKAVNLFIDRESLVEKYVENESAYFFEQLDKLSDKFIKCFCTQVICSTIGDAYDFFYYTYSENNIFYQNIKDLDSDTGKKLYKRFGFYHVICYEDENKVRMKAIVDAMSMVFNWNGHDKRMFRSFANMRKICDAAFEVSFARKMAQDIFGSDLTSPVVLALASNLFYNSHSMFLCEFESMKIAL